MSGAAPIIARVVDLETTGLEPPAEVVEAAYCDLCFVDGIWTVGQPVSWLCGVAAIPPEVRAVHHITMTEVAGLEPFRPESLLADGVIVYAAHNMSFEERWVGAAIAAQLGLDEAAAAPLLCTFKAALRVWPEAPGHSNGALRYWLEDQGLVSLDPALTMPPHRAGPDAYVTAHLLKALLAAGATGKQMVGWTREPQLMPRCPIGEWRGKAWPEVDDGFLRWMTRRRDMEADLKWNAWRELDRREGKTAA